MLSLRCLLILNILNLMSHSSTFSFPDNALGALSFLLLQDLRIYLSKFPKKSLKVLFLIFNLLIYHELLHFHVRCKNLLGNLSHFWLLKSVSFVPLRRAFSVAKSCHRCASAGSGLGPCGTGACCLLSVPHAALAHCARA